MDPLPSQRRIEIAELRSAGLTYSQIGRRLGICKSTVAYHCRRLGVPANDRFARRYDWAEVQTAIDAGMTVTQLTERFGFARASYSKAVERGEITPRGHLIPLADLFSAGRSRSRGHLKARLLSAGLKENRCETCGITEWNGKPLGMELHHVNGDGRDNRLENLMLLCGNCHSQTDNWGGRGTRDRRRAGA